MENFHSNTIVETLPSSTILIEDSDSQMEEIDIFTGTDELLPPKPSDVEFDFEPNSREVISVMMNNIDELNEDEYFDPGEEIDVFNFSVIHKSSISLKNTSQISSVHAVAPILSTKEPEYSPSMGYEYPNTTLETESDEIIKSGVEELVPISSENEVTSEDKKECDVPVCENSPICDDHSEILSDSNNDDDISSDDDDFEDIEYVEASLPNPEIVNLVEENDVYGYMLNHISFFFPN
uniref:Uncharacterized protein n=1 Tax=Tanacetum cinerariifolium TaxID=118510 RepID=A0A6L2MT55_TANCI|nr:hypothetical protein [Tanacetum cinerariifolium]